MAQQHKTNRYEQRKTTGYFGKDGRATPSDEVEAYRGQVEWHRFADSKGRLYRFGLIDLTEEAGRHFVWGARADYKLVVLFDVNNVGHAYTIKVGNGGDNDYLTPEYVHEKLGRALYFRHDTLVFTQKLAQLLGRPTAREDGSPVDQGGRTKAKAL